MCLFKQMILGLCCLGCCSAGHAATWYVTETGAGAMDGSDWDNAFGDIQSGINAAAAFDTVLVSNGVYQTGGVSNYPSGADLTNRIAIHTANVIVRSANNDPTNTIIKGNWDSEGTPCGTSAVRGVYMAADTVLIGFTITNGATFAVGDSEEKRGGGVYCFSATCIISNCIIRDNVATAGGGTRSGKIYNSQILNNTATGEGGGMRNSLIYDSTVAGNTAGSWGGGAGDGSVLTRCLITGNTSGSSGGGAAFASLRNCYVIGNTSGSYGGGALGQKSHIVERCMIVSNKANIGGGLGGQASDDRLRIVSCLIAGNSSTNGQGGGAYRVTMTNCTIVGNSSLGSGGGMYEVIIYNCVSWDNNKEDSATVTAYYSCGVGNLYTNTALGNTTNNPMFMQDGVGTGAALAMGNYRLQNGSPCVNTGTNVACIVAEGALDLDGIRRIDQFNNRVDMGCYELLSHGMMLKVR